MTKQDAPFFKLYCCVSPEDFVLLFNVEAPQTVAFILSFCPQKSFVRKVIRLFREKEEKNSTLKITCTIREYLSRCRNSSYDENLINIVEEQVSIMTNGYISYSGSSKIRKGILGKISLKARNK